MSPRTWFEFRGATSGQPAEIVIYDEIGLFGVSAADFQDELKALGDVDEIALRINSPGGDIFDGLAIYNMLKRHKASITVTVDGVAASMASVIAMAGDVVLMPENTYMMVHNPAGVVIGTSKEMRELAGVLDKIKQGMITSYVSKSGGDRDEIARLMDEETWLTAEEAVDLGLADQIEAAVKLAAKFDLTAKYQNVPNSLTARKRTKMSGTEPKPGEQQQPAPKPEEPKPGEQQPPEQQQQPAPPPAAGPTDAQAERQRAADVIAACQLAGRADLASGYVAGGKSLSEVVADLQTKRAAPPPRGDTEINTHNGGDPKPPLRVDLAADMRRRHQMKEGV